MPYWAGERSSAGTSSGSPSTTTTPSTAVKAIEDRDVVVLAPITGATAAMAVAADRVAARDQHGHLFGQPEGAASA